MNSGLFPLPQVRFPLSVDTIGQHIALGYEIWASCETTGCNHTVRVNLVLLSRYLGPEHGARATDLRRYFYCPKCREGGRLDSRISFAHYSCTAPHSIVSDPRQDNRPSGIKAEAV